MKYEYEKKLDVVAVRWGNQMPSVKEASVKHADITLRYQKNQRHKIVFLEFDMDQDRLIPVNPVDHLSPSEFKEMLEGLSKAVHAEHEKSEAYKEKLRSFDHIVQEVFG